MNNMYACMYGMSAWTVEGIYPISNFCATQLVLIFNEFPHFTEKVMINWFLFNISVIFSMENFTGALRLVKLSNQFLFFHFNSFICLFMGACCLFYKCICTMEKPHGILWIIFAHTYVLNTHTIDLCVSERERNAEKDKYTCIHTFTRSHTHKPSHIRSKFANSPYKWVYELYKTKSNLASNQCFLTPHSVFQFFLLFVSFGLWTLSEKLATATVAQAVSHYWLHWTVFIFYFVVCIELESYAVQVFFFYVCRLFAFVVNFFFLGFAHTWTIRIIHSRY